MTQLGVFAHIAGHCRSECGNLIRVLVIGIVSCEGEDDENSRDDKRLEIMVTVSGSERLRGRSLYFCRSGNLLTILHYCHVCQPVIFWLGLRGGKLFLTSPSVSIRLVVGRLIVIPPLVADIAS